MTIPYIESVKASKEFPLNKGDVLRISNPDGTRDIVELRKRVTDPRAKVQEFSSVTVRQFPTGNKPKVGW